MSDLFAAGFTPEEHELYGVRTRDGHVQIRVDPPLPGEKTHYKWTDPKIQKIAGATGVSRREEIEVLRDYAEDAPECERCGDTGGVQNHHVAPKEFFGQERAETWPQIQLCRPCHDSWHEGLEEGQREYWREVSRQASSFLDMQRRDPRPWRELFELWCHTKDLPERDRNRVYHIVKKTIEAET